MLKADWNWVIRQEQHLLQARGGPLPSWPGPVTVLPCELVLTCKHGTNGKVLQVRCRCQAGTREAPRARYYNYDMLGEAGSLPGALALWRAHREGRG